MKERPILFNGAMVRALLAGTKTQTRRVVKMKHYHQIEERDDGSPWPWMYDGEREENSWMHCPYGQPGDRLWVRETFAPRTLGAWSVLDQHMKPLYRADADRPEWKRIWRPSIHMPRWASRITLEVTNVRVERLQDITEADAKAEGIFPHVRGDWHWLKHDSGNPNDWNQFGYKTAALAFQALWESINGTDSWAANPWVWTVEFRRLP